MGNLCKQVQQVGSDIPTNVLWPHDRPLKPGTYRVVVKLEGLQAGEA